VTNQWQQPLAGRNGQTTKLERHYHICTSELTTSKLHRYPHSSKLDTNHRHRIDIYLDTLLANQPISDGEATDRCQRIAPQDGGLPELIVARTCVTNHSEAASLWLVMPKQDVVGNHQWRVVCNVQYLNFGMQNLRPSNIKVIFQRPSCGSPIAVASGFIAGTASVIQTVSTKHTAPLTLPKML